MMCNKPVYELTKLDVVKSIGFALFVLGMIFVTSHALADNAYNYNTDSYSNVDVYNQGQSMEVYDYDTGNYSEMEVLDYDTSGGSTIIEAYDYQTYETYIFEQQ